ncbi:MAG TPA: hypothetical protein VMT55_01695 [Candidatus Sulfotelmatobacter sp.]|nr:hypothetical protein [Candidatus Sulfotelmatobacter sp.]
MKPVKSTDPRKKAIEIYSLAAMIQNRVIVDVLVQQMNEPKTLAPLPASN